MGIINDIRNIKQLQKNAAIVQRLDKHVAKNCKHCNNFPMDDEFPVKDFVEHLLNEHSAELNINDNEDFESLIKYFTNQK